MLHNFCKLVYMFLLQFQYLFDSNNQIPITATAPADTIANTENMLPPPVVNIAQGKLLGVEEADYRGDRFYSFKGVPFAKPPVGELRFKPPVPADKWEGTREATEQPEACYQYEPFFLKTILGVEDCLYLNVFTKSIWNSGCKEQCSPALRPVMVFIHGGGFTSGSITTDLYGPEHLITADIVLVTIQYRLGLLGFLSLEDPELGVTGNAGLKDMILALRWVQENIKHFNGDPNNVTIFGESAGAAAVHYMVLSHQTKGLFHRAIMQSGSALNCWAYGRKVDLETLHKCGITQENLPDALQHLSQMPVDDLMNVQFALADNLDPNYARHVVPVVETGISETEAALLRPPLEIIQSGDYNQVPLIFGYNSREGLLANMFMQNPASMLGKDIETYVPHILFDLEKGSDDSKLMAEKIVQHYLNASELSEEQFEKDDFLQLVGDSVFKEGIRTAIRAHLTTAQHPIYVYEMTVESPLNLLRVFDRITRPGVCHADDLGYLFKTMVRADEIPLGSREDTLIQRFVQMWANFARCGNPTPPEAISEKSAVFTTIWTPCEKTAFNMLDIGEDLEMRINYDNDKIRFWQELPMRQI